MWGRAVLYIHLSATPQPLKSERTHLWTYLASYSTHIPYEHRISRPWLSYGQLGGADHPIRL
eukprot:scaffold184878_cov14-Prasinocladus_malaysianus.AAC.1